MISSKFSVLSMVFLVSACVSSGSDNVLQSAIQTDTSATTSNSEQITDVSSQKVASIPEKKPEQQEAQRIAFASEKPAVTHVQVKDQTPPTLPPKPRVQKTYLINGLASSVESIGYGLTNLSKKIPNSKLHNYTSFVESSTLIRTKVTREIKAAYAKNPDVEINLIGISFGANIVTWIAEDLNRKDVPINYLATLEGPAMSRIRKNVRLADNFSCTGLNCFRTSSKLSWGNKKTEFNAFKIKSGHVSLANHAVVHERIISQINKPLEPVEPQQYGAQ